MRALVLEEYGEPLALRELDRPEPASRGVVVEVAACGICRSDWHAWRGHGEWADDRVPLGQVLGHEPAGRVAAVGDEVERVAAGDRVVVPFGLGEGSCRHCRSGRGNRCTDGWALGFETDAPGAFAEYVHVPAADYNVVQLPDDVPFRAAAALGCRYATAYNALAIRGDVDASDDVAVFGCGGLGLSAVQIAAGLGARPIAVDVREAALDAAREVGADAVVDADATLDADATPDADGSESAPSSEPAQAVREIPDGGVDVAVDALGSAETCRAGVDALRRGGVFCQVGLTGDDERGEIALPTDRIARDELDVRGVRGMPPSRYDELLALVASGEVDPGALVRREVGLADVSDRLAAMDEYDTVGIELVTSFRAGDTA